jgi:hypothetical protein
MHDKDLHADVVWHVLTESQKWEYNFSQEIKCSFAFLSFKKQMCLFSIDVLSSSTQQLLLRGPLCMCSHAVTNFLLQHDKGHCLEQLRHTNRKTYTCTLCTACIHLRLLSKIHYSIYGFEAKGRICER